ncbi:hypothetical protein AVEN_146783-1 [Araneus ventricosus]|uniref:Uncharacterized protein n=1 Tax=Araneus ventricosus TaxID=182803 RepID=A0A4Y2D7F5_ARAVE|nr:hypothetical protein AVEN_146783-1 [Araneus ventricosus]
MIILIWMVVLIEVLNAHHQYHDFNNVHRHRREELLNSAHHHIRKLRHVPEDHRRVKLIPKIYSQPFKTKRLYQDLLTSEKFRASRQDQQKKEKWSFNPHNLRQSSNRRNYPLYGENTVRNIKPHPVVKNGYRHFPSVRSNPLLLKNKYNTPVAVGKIPGVALSENSKPFNSFRSPLIANPHARVHPNFKMKRYNVAFLPKKREDITSKREPRQKKSLFSRFYVGDTLYMIELFFICIPLVSLSAVVLGIANYCWRRRFRKAICPRPCLEQNSESTIGSALLEEHIMNNIHPPNLTKSESEIWRSLVTNEIDADGDKVGKRMKLERWMYQKCKCCPEDREKIKNKLRLLRQSKPQDDQSRNNKGTVSDSNIPLVPNPRLSPTIRPPVEAPFPSSSRQEESINDSRYPVTVNPSDQHNSLRTFDSHIKITREVKDKKNRRESKNRKPKDKGLKDSTNKYSSEPFGAYDKVHKTRKR